MFSPAYLRYEPLSVGWRLPHDLVLAFHPVGGMTGVFNEESGDTHLLEPVAGTFLQRLADGDVIAGGSLHDVAREFEQAGFDPGRVLCELHVLGLAEPYEP